MSIFIRILKSVPLNVLFKRIVNRLFVTRSYFYNELEFRETTKGHVFNPIVSDSIFLDKTQLNFRDFEFFGLDLESFKKIDKSSVLKVHNVYSENIFKMISENYSYFDWQLDIKSNFRFDENKQYNKQSYIPKSVDIKIPWELGRLQHLPILSLEILSTKDEKLIREYKNQVFDFIASNPIGMGVQWTSSMDVGIRLSNLLISYDLLFDILKTDVEFNEVFLDSVYLHAQFIFNHLEYKEGLTGNHYLFNLIGLLFASTYLKETVEIKKWNSFSITEIEQEIFKQFFDDGGNFEGSTSYHCLSAEMMVYATALMLKNGVNLSGKYIDRLYSIGEFISRITKPDGMIPQFGDNDSGRLFKFPKNKYNDLNSEALLAAFSGLFNHAIFKVDNSKFSIERQIIQQLSGGFILNPSLINLKKTSSTSSKDLKFKKQTIISFDKVISLEKINSYSYSDFGIHIFKSDIFYLAISTIANKNMHHSWGHVHNDKLSFELYVDGKDLVSDPGSCCYTSNRVLRNEFRSTIAHHSIIVNGIEQNKWINTTDWGLFYLDREVKCKVLEISDYSIKVSAKYYGIHHIRSFEITKDQLIINDYCNKSFDVNINKFEKYSPVYGSLKIK